MRIVVIMGIIVFVGFWYGLLGFPQVTMALWNLAGYIFVGFIFFVVVMSFVGTKRTSRD